MHAKKGGHVLGICNGFQILLETGLLPGALMRNAGLKFICRSVALTPSPPRQRLHRGLRAGRRDPAARGASRRQLRRRRGHAGAPRGEDRVAFRYAEPVNGSADDIAGILSENRRVLGMMPHPERAAEPLHGGTDGAPLFRSLVAQALAQA
jgi:phosphoribosylformylglycinamidine synthase subunit PurQ / glutaminase